MNIAIAIIQLIGVFIASTFFISSITRSMNKLPTSAADCFLFATGMAMAFSGTFF